MSFHIFTQIMMSNTTQSIEIPFLPTSIWGLMSGLSLILVLLACGMYVYYHKRLKAMIKDSEDVADLAARKTILEAEIKQCQNWLNMNRERLLESDAKVVELNKLEQELASLLIKLSEEKQKVDDLSKESTSLQNVISTLAQDRDRIINEITAGQKLLEKNQNDVNKSNNEIENVSRKLRDVEQQYQEKTRAFDLLEQKLSDFSSQKFGLENEIEQNQNQLNSMIKELEKIEVERKQQEILRQELESLQLKITRSQQELKNILMSVSQHEIKHQELIGGVNFKQEQLNKIQNEIKQAEEELEGIKRPAGISAGTGDKGSYDDLFKIKPECFMAEVFPGGNYKDRSEVQSLADTLQFLKNQGLSFPKRTVYAFHTSLKINDISPITVLAGISGTGKTLLPVKYAEAMGMHNMVVSVQPGWDSPRDLFGFYNYMEKKYKGTDLARALIRMDPYNFKEQFKVEERRADRVLLVLLDEMNLARIEYYFSEFLSKLELRRAIKDAEVDNRSIAEFVLETGPQSDGKGEFRLWVGRNVIFVGTMNEDESTQTLSDKVLDRANVLRFGKPPNNLAGIQNERTTAQPQNKFLPYNLWKEWIKKPLVNDFWLNVINEWINLINDALEKVGRPFGHRVQQAMREYVANYPGVDDGRTHKIAFADQIEQKVIPKLRGIDFSGTHLNESLDIIYRLIDDLKDEELAEAFRQSKEDNSMGTFVWRGVTRSLDNMRV
ncbi:hypothetical protein [Candidatus Kuenenia sp.]|uniref:McrB family protein n=1 Tax=Candidatus Kuenenia sp. TaxID=2499824 RepID=UPI0032208A4C